jgi:hypothetical protein
VNGAFAGAANSSQLVGNIGLFPNVASNAMTVNLLTGTGSTPSSGSPVIINYRSTTNSIGQYFSLSTTGALSITVPSGATLGQVSGVTEPTYVYMQDHLGTNQLCVSSNPAINEGSIQASTTISAGATSRSVLYCPAGVTAPVRMIGKIVSNQATAGTWASAPTNVEVLPFDHGVIVASGGGLSSMDFEYWMIVGACSAGSCSLNTASPGISSVTRNSTGNYSVAFTSGSFTNSGLVTGPACTCTAAAGNLCTIPISGNTGLVLITTVASSSAAVDSAGISLTCMGLH